MYKFSDVSEVFAASISVMMEAASTSEASINYHTSNSLHTLRRENLKSHLEKTTLV
jgi:hypothetical protein